MTLSIKGAAVPGWLGVYKNPDGFFVLTIAGHSTVIDQEEADRLARYVDSRYQDVPVIDRSAVDPTANQAYPGDAGDHDGRAG